MTLILIIWLCYCPVSSWVYSYYFSFAVLGKTLRICAYLGPHQTFSPRLSIHWWIFIKPIFTMLVTKMVIFHIITSSTFINWHLTKKEEPSSHFPLPLATPTLHCPSVLSPVWEPIYLKGCCSLLVVSDQRDGGDGNQSTLDIPPYVCAFTHTQFKGIAEE